MALKPADLQWGEDDALRSAAYGDIYFQTQAGPAESYYVFLERNDLPRRFAAARTGMQVAELGFGSGLNFLLTAREWQKSGAGGELLFVSIEKHPIRKADLQKLYALWPELGDISAALLAQYPPALEGFYHLHFPQARARLMLCLGDVADVLPQLSGAFDAWYLDGFAPAKNPAMWEEKLFALIAARTKPGGTLATFSSAGAVRRGLTAAGFAVEKVEGYGVKRDMTVAQLPGAAVAAAVKKVTVLGAGLGGAAAAYALARRGFAVTVLDRQPQAAEETSGNPVAVLFPKLTADRSKLGEYFQHGLFFTRNLATALGLASWNPCGVVDLDVDAEEAQRHKAMAGSGYWPEEFMSYDGKALQLPYGGCLSPPELCRALLDHPRITTRFSTAAPALHEIEADAVVIAMNYNSSTFAETAWLPLVAVRGQMTFLKATAESAKLKNVVCYDGSISPAVNGVHYAGATFSREGYGAPDLRETDDRENLQNLTTYLPQLGFVQDDIVGARAGFRTSLPDHLPVVGRCPDIEDFKKNFNTRGFTGKYLEKIYLAAGFGGQGLSGALLAGDIVAAQIAGEPLPIPQNLLPFIAPERFIIRDLKRGKI